MKNKTATPKISSQNIKGILYSFEDYPYWDAEKQQMRHKRIYIGKFDNNGAFIPNKSYSARLQLEEERQSKETKTHSSILAKRRYSGATCLLDAIGDKIGVEADLKHCFPDDYRKILSLAYYLILESDSPMYRFKKWSLTHYHPFGSEIPSQRISELFESIPEGAKLEFFKRQSQRRLEKEYLAYDTTSISSYSELIDHAKYGHNKDGDALPQINLALVFGEKSMLPVYYRKLPGNITDVSTVRKLLKDVKFLDISKVKLVMDRGFYSAYNINSLYTSHYKFLIGARRNNDFISQRLGQVRETIRDFKYYSLEHGIYCIGSTEKWKYRKPGSANKDYSNETRRIYVHIYYDGQRAEDEKASFMKALSTAEQALQKTSATDEQKELASRYFTKKETPIRGLQIGYNEQAIREHVSCCGYFALLSNEIKDPKMALDIYRNKDLVEKAFCNLKNRLDMKRTSVSSSESLEGKLFVQFVALIYMSFIHKVMKEKKLYMKYTMPGLLDELDIIESFEYAGSRIHYGEITEKQQGLFACFDFTPPLG
jgi:hypothetical protein